MKQRIENTTEDINIVYKKEFLLLRLIKRFPANFFFLISLISLGIGIFFSVSVLVDNQVYSSGIATAFFIMFAGFGYGISIISFIWSLLLRKLTIKDIIRKEVSIIKRVFIVFSLCSVCVIIFYLMSLGYEYLYPEQRFYKEQGISISDQSKDFKPCDEIPSVSYGGKKYETIQIGTQCWIKDNLNIGDMIVFDQKPGAFDNKVQKHCYQDKIENCDTYGGLYSFYEASDYSLKEGTQGICPDGWRLPTESEIDVMDTYLRCGAQHDIACENKMTGKAIEAGFLNYVISPKYGYFFHPGKVYDSLSHMELNNGKSDSNDLFVKCIKVKKGEVLTVTPDLKGSGTFNDPYLISKLEDFEEVNKDLEAYYNLTNDIDASITKTWEEGEGFLPIGSFNGTLNGNNHTISNLHLANLKNSKVGLFSDISIKGVVRNIKLTNVYIKGIATGGISGYNDGLIENVSVQGRMNGLNDIGGIAGANIRGTIRYAHADIVISGDILLGGITGDNANEVSDSYAQVYIERVGGRKGLEESAGLLVGDNRGRVVNCYAVASNTLYRKLDLVGSEEKNSSNSYASIFYQDGNNTNYIGQGYDQHSNNYSLTEDAFRNKATYVDWDFTDIWNVPVREVNNGYPTLRDRLINNEESPYENGKMSIFVKKTIDQWGSHKMDLSWSKEGAPYALVLSGKDDNINLNEAEISYYGKETSIRIYSKEARCFKVFGVDSNFKLIEGLVASTCYTLD
ncbi:MAG: hypothetical protein MNSN_03960 [Minisyncoccus archaeiphilus]|uniref:FISUMP domain-containing protein n=1 Tax=Minisyncoccus archaeiphilus TaxID=3238481 RepID=UPI002B17C41B|nr:MAG: hypothetical protein MNSN_03960 [Candidatus Parcubacteria bacterium]